MSLGAPFAVPPDRRCYVVYVGEDEPIELHGTPSEVKKEAQRRMDALKSAQSTSLRTKLRNIPLRRKSSVATGASAEDEEPCVSRINLLDLPNEILDAVLNAVGVKNFYEDPARLAVCKRWHQLVRVMMARSVELDVNSLVRVVAVSRPSLVRKILGRRSSAVHRRNSADSGAADSDSSDKIGLRLGALQHFDADLRIINGFTVRNHVPIERNSHYKQWKSDVDSSFEWLATHVPAMACLKTFRLRAWTAVCLIAERRDRQWQRLARDTVANLARLPHLDRVELDFCGTDFTWMRCGWRENGSSCAAVAALLPRVRALRVRLQSLCPAALTLPPTATTPLPRLEELVINHDTTEANPWSQSGPSAGLCMRPEEGYAGPGLHGGNREIVRAMRRLLASLSGPDSASPPPSSSSLQAASTQQQQQQRSRPRLVRFLWMDNEFEKQYDPQIKLPLNKSGNVAYRGSMAYDLLTEKVQRLGFLAAWDSEGTEIVGCRGHLWEEENEGAPSATVQSGSAASAGSLASDATSTTT